MKTAQIYWDLLLSWQNLLDIALIAAGIFFLYRMFLRLGTWKIMSGILAAFLFYVVANVLNLEGIEWIFKNVSQVALLALIILFQPEIRRIFEKLVSLRISKGRNTGADEVAIVATSLWSLAQQKRGAIIVYPGKEQIIDKTSGGYKLNAIPSKPLLLSIFDPNSAGHDGAVIIIDGILTDLAVRLPISSSSKLSAEYGTRHHAAMGMAEEKDALVLLVSEERGHVLSFNNGSVKQLASEAEIVTVITAHLEMLSITQRLRQVSINRRTALQIAGCTAIALTFWSTMIVSEKQMVERSLSIPIEYTAPLDGLIFSGNRINQLALLAAGPKSAINDFILSEPKAIVDLAKYAEGTQRIVISSDNIKHPKEVTLIDVTPSELNITLSNPVPMKMEITPQFIGKLPPHLTLNSIEITPREIAVLGPPSQENDKERFISTTPIYLNDLQRSSVIIGKLIAPPFFQPIEKRWPEVEIKITLEKKPAE